MPSGDGNIYLSSFTTSLPPGTIARLMLEAIPVDISYSGPWEWNLPLTSSIAFPFYQTTDGLTGYRFSISVTMTPEPSSLIALTGCLLMAAGLMRRRR